MRLEARATKLGFKAIGAALAVSAIPPEQRITAAYYLLVTIGNVPGALVAEACNCSRQNVSKALGKVEDRRDSDPQFGAEMDRLERMMMEAM